MDTDGLVLYHQGISSYSAAIIYGLMVSLMWYPLLISMWQTSVTGGFSSKKQVARSFDVFVNPPEQTVEQTIEKPVIWKAIELVMTSL